MSSSLLLLSQHFVHYGLQPSSDACRSGQPLGNFELNPLLNQGGVDCSHSAVYV